MYGKDDPFQDPVLRCDSCAELLFAEDLKKHGMCLKCGNRKVRNLQSFNDDEKARMVERGIDPKFLELFEGVA